MSPAGGPEPPARPGAPAPGGVRRSDPFGKRALYWLPVAAVTPPGDSARGRRALFSSPSSEPARAAGRGWFVVRCQRCGGARRVGVSGLALHQLPFALWWPRGGFDHRMICPSCRRRAWASVTIRD